MKLTGRGAGRQGPAPAPGVAENGMELSATGLPVTTRWARSGGAQWPRMTRAADTSPIPPGLDLRCRAPLQALVRERLSRWPVQGLADDERLRAAVVLALADEGEGADLPGLPLRPGYWSDRAAVLVTLRAASLRAHAGQFALPGGRIDAGETPEQAALRELHEELGLALPPQAVCGRLDDMPTRSGYVITPVVVWAGVARDLRPHVAEVARVHRLPLTELLRPDAPLLDVAAGQAHPTLRMPVGSIWIAAPTAAMLYQFREVCLLERATRVAHFEHPRFAWS